MFEENCNNCYYGKPMFGGTKVIKCEKKGNEHKMDYKALTDYCSDYFGPNIGYDLRKLKSCGKDVIIAPTVKIKYPELVTIGDHCAIDDYTIITVPMTIGDYVHIAPQTTIVAGGKDVGCILGNFVGIAAGCRIICGGEDYIGDCFKTAVAPAKYRGIIAKPVNIENYCLLGTNTIVHMGVTVKEGSTTGSFTLLTKDTEPWGLYVGIPGKRVKEIPHEKIFEYAKELGY
jgi:dTDP-4-amino-4,6-dideoxy-D-glucose acyltransferase